MGNGAPRAAGITTITHNHQARASTGGTPRASHIGEATGTAAAAAAPIDALRGTAAIAVGTQATTAAEATGAAPAFTTTAATGGVRGEGAREIGFEASTAATAHTCGGIATSPTRARAATACAVPGVGATSATGVGGGHTINCVARRGAAPVAAEASAAASCAHHCADRTGPTGAAGGAACTHGDDGAVAGDVSVTDYHRTACTAATTG